MSRGDHIRRTGRLKPILGLLQKRPSVFLQAVGLQVFAPCTRLVDSLWRGRGKTDLSPQAVPCAFLVCPPRSGGTLIYQALVRTLPSIYISNFHAFFPRAGSALLRRSLSRETDSAKPFVNFYGYSPGLSGVYEGNDFLGWLHNDVNTAAGEEGLRHEFTALLEMLSPLSGECVVFKNARSFQDLKRLHRAVPEIVFVRIRRNLEDVVQSVVKAAREVGSFHPVPPKLRQMSTDDPIAFAIAQIEEIDRQLDRQFETMAPASRYEIRYEDFCKRPRACIRELAVDYLKLPAEAIRPCAALDALRVSTRKKVSREEAESIRQLLQAI